MNEQATKRRLWPWVVAALAMLLAYPMTFGPACWLAANSGFGASFVRLFYWPVFCQLELNGDTIPNPVIRTFWWYGTVGIQPAKSLRVRVNDSTLFLGGSHASP